MAPLSGTANFCQPTGSANAIAGQKISVETKSNRFEVMTVFRGSGEPPRLTALIVHRSGTTCLQLAAHKRCTLRRELMTARAVTSVHPKRRKP